MDFFDAKGALEGLFLALGLSATFEPALDPMLQPGRTAAVLVQGARVGVVAEIGPQAKQAFDLLPRKAACFEIDLHALLPLMPAKGRTYQALPRFPGLVRDLALVVDEAVPAQQVAAVIAATPLVREVSLFDVYSGERIPAGKKSLAFRLVMQ